MKSSHFLLAIACTITLVGWATTKQTDSVSNLEKAQETLGSLYQNYSIKDSHLLHESYPFDE